MDDVNLSARKKPLFLNQNNTIYQQKWFNEVFD